MLIDAPDASRAASDEPRARPRTQLARDPGRAWRGDDLGIL
jgi:hypothetical protein